MPEDPMFSAILAALGRQGVLGPRASRLAQEWIDHVREDAERRVEVGGDRFSAERAAWSALGTLDDLALCAAREFAKGSWFGRHPWIAGFGLPLTVCVILSAALFWGSAWCVGVFSEHSRQLVNMRAVEWCPRVFHWLPWLLSIAWLVWMVRRMPGGWRLFEITIVALALCSTAFHMTIHPPLYGPVRGSLLVELSGPCRLLCQALLQLLEGPSAGPSGSLFSGAIAWVQSALLLAMGLVVRLRPQVFARSVGPLREVEL